MPQPEDCLGQYDPDRDGIVKKDDAVGALLEVVGRLLKAIRGEHPMGKWHLHPYGAEATALVAELNTQWQAAVMARCKPEVIEHLLSQIRQKAIGPSDDELKVMETVLRTGATADNGLWCNIVGYDAESATAIDALMKRGYLEGARTHRGVQLTRLGIEFLAGLHQFHASNRFQPI